MTRRRCFSLLLAAALLLALLPLAEARGDDQVQLTLHAEPADGGTVSGGGAFTPGSGFTVKAVAKAGWRFVQWYSSKNLRLDNSQAAETSGIMVDQDADLYAYFEKVPALLEVAVDPAGCGTVTGSGSYTIGDQAQLTVSPADGYALVKWEISSGAKVTLSKTDKSPTTCTMADGYVGGKVTAILKQVYPLTVSADPAGGGTVTGDGRYYRGQQIPLKATVHENFEFVKWEAQPGTDVSFASATSAETTCTMGNNYTGGTVKAVFRQLTFRVTAASEPAAGGAVAGAGTYEPQDTVTLTATPYDGYRFKEWRVTKGGVTVGANGTFTMPESDVEVTAVWTPKITVVWLNGDDSVLDEKTYWADEQEPTTDKKATRAQDDLYNYVFVDYDNGSTQGNVKTYKPLFTFRPVYTLVSGSGTNYRLQSGKKLVLTVKRTVDEDTITDDLSEVKVGGTVLVRGKDYTVTKGSAVVTIKPSAMNKLSVGRQTVTISFTDGRVRGTVNVKDALDDQSGTGDNSHMFLWLGVAVIGLLGLVALQAERKRCGTKD